MPINAHPEFVEAEKKFYDAQTDKERLEALEEMISKAPSHKGAETLRVNLKSRYKKLKEKLEKNQKKAKAWRKAGIKKSDMQVSLLGLTNSGKSSILKALTNANPIIASYGFSTKEPEIGIMNYENCQIQIIDLPPLGSENFDLGIINTTDTVLMIIEKLHEISELEKALRKAKAKRIIVFNKSDLYDEALKRKISETLKAKRCNFVLVSTKTNEGISELKEKIFKSFDKIRIYTKQPNEKEHDNLPLIMPPDSIIEDVIKRIIHSSAKIRKIRIWGPSSKFAGQIIGVKHILKDKDILEFNTR